jgi:leader peptidase (prepilin peptidase) / N-methyltransferase
MSLAAGVSGLMGLLVGSFLNVVAHRLPRGESLSRPRSRCPACRTTIRARDNIPVVSWLALGGRCRACRRTIPLRYPLVEAVTALLCALVVVVRGADPEVVLGVVLVLLLVPITLIDLDHRIIPNRLTYPGAIVAVALVALLDREALPEHLLAGAAAGGFLLLAAIAYPAGMGMGDVKLAAVLGLFLGSAVAPAMFAALMLGTLAGAAVMTRRGVAVGRRTAIPFGPFLAAGGVVGLLAGDAIVRWYLATL